MYVYIICIVICILRIYVDMHVLGKYVHRYSIILCIYSTYILHLTIFEIFLNSIFFLTPPTVCTPLTSHVEQLMCQTL